MKNLPFTGSAVAIVTPFIGDKIDYDAFGEIIEIQIANKTDAIVVCGTTGEASTMPNEEHIEAIEYCVKKVAGRVPVIAGTGSNDTLHAIMLTKAAEDVGADAILSVTPYYNKANQKGLVEHFKAIANCVNIPIILYNVPGRTGLSFSIDSLKELAKIVVERGYGRFEWTCLAWNQPSIDFYLSLGAEQKDWNVFHLTGDNLKRIAGD